MKPLISIVLRILTVVLFAVVAVSLYAQDVYVDVNSTSGTADFLLGSRLVEDAAYTGIALTLSSILSDNSRAYLDVNHTRIFPVTDYSSSSAELGLQLRYLDIKDNQLFAGLFAYTNLYEDTFSYYENTGFGLYGKWKYYFKATQLVTMGYDLNFKKFQEVAEASNTEHELYAIYNQSFKTRSSVNLRLAYALQDFWSQSVVVGRGRHYYVQPAGDIASNELFTGELRLSQSIGTRMGLTLWLNTQNLLNGVTDSLLIQDGLDNPFTDRFRWEGSSATVRLLYRINSQNSLQFNQTYSVKRFQSVPVYQFDFQVMDFTLVDGQPVDLGYDREDQRNSINLRWSHTWAITRYDWLSDLSLDIGGGWTANRSNDPLYDYNSMSTSIGIQLNN